MTKFHISYRNAKGQMKSADPFNMPADAPAEVMIAAEAIRDAMTVRDLAEPVKRGRGRPKGHVCSAETRARMAEARNNVVRRARESAFADRVAGAWEGVSAEVEAGA